MSGWCKLKEYLLDYIPHLEHIEFCVHSDAMNIERNRRRNFDRWIKKEVISIFHLHQFLTRFTMPYSFDQLDYVHLCYFGQELIILKIQMCNIMDKQNFLIPFEMIWIRSFVAYQH